MPDSVISSVDTSNRTSVRTRKRVQQSHRKRCNMVIPETAADPILTSRSSRGLAQTSSSANYSVVMTCVHASRNKCREQGRGREVKGRNITTCHGVGHVESRSDLQLRQRVGLHQRDSLCLTTPIGRNEKSFEFLLITIFECSLCTWSRPTH